MATWIVISTEAVSMAARVTVKMKKKITTAISHEGLKTMDHEAAVFVIVKFKNTPTVQ